MIHCSRFEHERGVIEYAYRLVREYEEHERQQDIQWKRDNPDIYDPAKKKKTRSPEGGFKRR